MVLFKKVLRTMGKQKTNTLASLMLIALSSALFTSFSTAGPQALKAINEFRADYQTEDAEFFTGKEIDQPRELEERFSVLLEKRRIADVNVWNGATLRLAEKTKQLNRYQVTEGEDLEKDGDIVVNRDFAVKNGKRIGDIVELNGTALRIKGYLAEPDYLYMLKNETDIVSNPKGFGFAAASGETVKAAGEGFFVYSVKSTLDNVNSFKEFVNREYVITKWLDRADNPRISAVDGDMGGFVQLGRILPVFILAIAGMLIAIVQWRIIKSEFNQMGTLYALGYSKKSLLVHYLSYPSLLVLAGGLLGQIPGLLLMKPLVATQAVQYNFPVIRLEWSPGVMLWSLLLPFLFIIPVCLLVIRKALRLPPVELIKGVMKDSGPSLLERIIPLGRLKFRRRFQIREILRNIPRTFLTFFGVMFASFLLLMSFIFHDSIQWIFQDGYEDTYRYKHLYTFNGLQFDGSADGEKLWIQGFKAKKKGGKEIDMKLQGMERGAGLIRLVDRDGERLAYDQTIITAALSRKLGVRAGDSLTISSKIDGKPLALRIDAIAQNDLGDNIYVPVEVFYERLGLPPGSYVALMSEKPLTFSPATVLLDLKKSDMIAGFREMTKPLNGVLLYLGSAAAVIGLVMIYIVTALIIEENRNAISLLKIIGYSPPMIYSLILNSNTPVVIAAFAASVPFTLWGTGALFAEITSSMDFSIPARIDPIHVGISFVIIMTAYELAKRLTRKRILRISLGDALKTARE